MVALNLEFVESKGVNTLIFHKKMVSISSPYIAAFPSTKYTQGVFI